MNLKELHCDVYELALGYYVLNRTRRIWPHGAIPISANRIHSSEGEITDRTSHIQTWMSVDNGNIVFDRRLYTAIGSLPDELVGSEQLGINPRLNQYSYCTRRVHGSFPSLMAYPDVLIEIRDDVSSELTNSLESLVNRYGSHESLPMRRLFRFGLDKVVADISTERIDPRTEYRFQEADDPLIDSGRVISTSIHRSPYFLTFNWENYQPNRSQLDSAFGSDILLVSVPNRIEDIEEAYGLEAYRKSSQERKTTAFSKLRNQFYLNELVGSSVLLEIHVQNGRIVDYNFILRESYYDDSGKINDRIIFTGLSNIMHADYTPLMGELFGLSYLMSA